MLEKMAKFHLIRGKSTENLLICVGRAGAHLMLATYMMIYMYMWSVIITCGKLKVNFGLKCLIFFPQLTR